MDIFFFLERGYGYLCTYYWLPANYYFSFSYLQVRSIPTWHDGASILVGALGMTCGPAAQQVNVSQFEPPRQQNQ